MNTEFVRIVADVELRDGVFATKEVAAMCLEPMGKVRIVSVDDGKGKNDQSREKSVSAKIPGGR